MSIHPLCHLKNPEGNWKFDVKRVGLKKMIFHSSPQNFTEKGGNKLSLTELEYLKANTKYDEGDIREWYRGYKYHRWFGWQSKVHFQSLFFMTIRGFKAECPDGNLGESAFLGPRGPLVVPLLGPVPSVRKNFFCCCYCCCCCFCRCWLLLLLYLM